MNRREFLGKYIISVQLEALAGLHIGGSTTGFEIGGVDNPVIRDPLTDEPYIPGSSLKGKLRHLTEWSLGLIDRHPKHGIYGAYHCEDLKKPNKEQADNPERWEKAYLVGRLFGVASDDSAVRQTAGPTRLTVRDAFLVESARKEIQQTLGEGIFTELKTENFLDRITSEANPRTMERVPAGARFWVQMVLDRYADDGRELLRQLFAAMRLLEDSTLGGSGSRGSGRVAFRQLRVTWRGLDYYLSGAEEQILFPNGQMNEEERRQAMAAPLRFLQSNGAFERFFGEGQEGG
ncbi:MAG: type III-A CRISPR-associated RAMP protein Csm3 [Armatimonadota bacterium]|nr:type III-A CRISPR-associated RAMP protein Csm3 [bacterium]MDW8321825.1 type III-A CRISPR-associated RAMP protein Csm3 [Armatimonadota bacterium]